MSIFEYNQEEHIKAEKKESYADGREDGRIEGLEEGRAEALRESVLKILSSKGDVSDELRERILKQTDTEVLAGWFDFALNITNIEDFRKLL